MLRIAPNFSKHFIYFLFCFGHYRNNRPGTNDNDNNHPISMIFLSDFFLYLHLFVPVLLLTACLSMLTLPLLVSDWLLTLVTTWTASACLACYKLFSLHLPSQDSDQSVQLSSSLSNLPLTFVILSPACSTTICSRKPAPSLFRQLPTCEALFYLLKPDTVPAFPACNLAALSTTTVCLPITPVSSISLTHFQ